MATDKYSEKYGQLSGADLEILGAREQAATARALRNAFKPAQGQMVGGWYVKPSWTQNLADAMMQYNNYKNEQAGTAKAQELLKVRQDLSTAADKYKANATPEQPGYQIATPAIESGATNAKLDELLAGGYGSDAQGQPLFSDAATTPSAMPNDGAQAYIPPTAEAQGNVNANPTNNQYMGDQLANAVRNAPLEGAGAGANNQSALPPLVGGQNIPAGGQASADGTMPAVTVTPEPEPSQLAQMLRGEGEYAPVEKASVRDIPAVPSNFDQRTYARMLDKASRHAEAASEWKDIETQSTNEQHRLSNIATIAGRNADNIATNYRFAIIAANQLANKQDTDKAIAEAKKQAHDADLENKKWQTNETNKARIETAQIGADVRKEIAANKPEKPLTEYQGKSLAYGLRSQDANDVIEKIGTNYSPLAIDAYKKVEGVPGVGTGAYALLSDTDKQVSQAQRNFVNAVLRQESGAVISKEEFVNAQKQYFPQPGDDAATLQQKSDNRKRVISSFKTSAGRTVEGEFARPAPTTAPSAPSYIVNKKTGKTMVSTDGEKTWQEVK